jgi:hypothetical protein
VRSNKVGGVLGVVAMMLVLLAPGSASAQTAPRQEGVHGGAAGDDAESVVATFEGGQIDLGGDWGEAQACLVWRQGGVLECFRTAEALDARAQELEPQRAATAPPPSDSTEIPGTYAAYSCVSSLRLFDYNWYGGRQLSFWDRGYWQNLGDYGFDNRTSSYIVGGCYVHLAEQPHGYGWWYGGPTYPYAGEPAMPWYWQNSVSSIYIE